MTFRQLLGREWREARHDARRFVFLFGAAIAYLIVFGMLYLPNLVQKIPTVILDADQTWRSREIVQAFADCDSFRIAAYPVSEEEMQAMLREKQTYLAIEIPADFSRRMVREGTANVLYLANGSNIIMANITSMATSNLLADISGRWGAERAALALGTDERILLKKISPVQTEYRVLYNTTQGYLYFFLIGLAMAAFQQGILFAMGASLQQEYEGGDFPVSWGRLLAAKVLFYWFFSMLSFMLVLLLLDFGVEIPCKASWAQLFVLGSVYVFGTLGFCALVSSFFRQEIHYVRFIIMYPVPAFILSGYTWPQESMGSAMNVLAGLSPLTYLSNNMRELLLSGNAPHYWESVGILLMIGFVSFIGARFNCYVINRKSSQRHIER